MGRDNRESSYEGLARKEAKSSKKILTEDATLHSCKAMVATTSETGAAKEERTVGVFILPELFGGSAGDCTMQAGATLALYPTGVGSFNARVRSTDDDDEWKMHFVVTTPGGEPLVYLPPRIQVFGQWIHPYWVKELPNPEDGYYDWHIDFPYDANVYSQFTDHDFADSEYSC